MQEFDFESSSDVAGMFRDKLVQTKSDAPQTWPLVKKTAIWGPWQNLYRASYVDLPGFGDVNAARNRIAEE